MTVMRLPEGILRAHWRDLPEEGWANGGGITRTLAFGLVDSAPADAAWDWRVSLAEITQPGAFSLLPGIERQAALLQGPELILTKSDGPELAFESVGSVHRFAGEARLSSKPLKGPAQLCNLMARRGRADGHMTVERSWGVTAEGAADHVLLVARGSFRVAISGSGVPSGLDLLMEQGEVLHVRRADALLAWENVGGDDLLVRVSITRRKDV